MAGEYRRSLGAGRLLVGGTARLCARGRAQRKVRALPLIAPCMARSASILFCGRPEMDRSRVHVRPIGPTDCRLLTFGSVEVSIGAGDRRRLGVTPQPEAGSCTIRTCCARLGACAPLSDPPPPPRFENQNSHGCSVVARRCTSPWPMDRRGRRHWSPCAQDTSSGASACSYRRALAAVGSSGSGGRRRQCSSRVAFAAHVCGTTGRRRARDALQLCCCLRHGGCATCRDALEHVLVVQ